MIKKIKPLSLKKRYTADMILLVVISITISVLQLAYLDDIFFRIAENEIVEVTENILDLDMSDKDFLYKISTIESKAGVYVELYQNNENLVYTTNTNTWIYGQNDVEAAEMNSRVMKVLGHKENADGSFFEERQEYYGSAKYIVYENQKGNIKAVVFYSEDVLSNIVEIANIILLGIAFWFMVTGVLILSVYSLQILQPISLLKRITTKLANMDFSESVPEIRVKDLNKLGKNINKMSNSLEYHITSLRKKNQQLEYELERKNRYEAVRKQFIANASHELKTPIAIIQSYAEGIKYGDDHDVAEEYCDIILDETDKMNNLLIKLMEMVKYENRKSAVNQVNFDVSKWLENILVPLSRIIEENNIKFETDIDENIQGYGDPELLEQVVSNYLSNAMSHCDGERIIRLSLKSGNDYSTITVFNSGGQIQENDLPYIWDSFYRADKSHSRAEGRFGLGLAIVKTIQLIHRCSYDVENLPDGVQFSFDINNAKKS